MACRFFMVTSQPHTQTLSWSRNLLWDIAKCFFTVLHLRTMSRGHAYISRTGTFHSPVRNDPLNMIKGLLKVKILPAGPLSLSSKVHMGVKLGLFTVRD